MKRKHVFFLKTKCMIPTPEKHQLKIAQTNQQHRSAWNGAVLQYWF